MHTHASEYKPTTDSLERGRKLLFKNIIVQQYICKCTVFRVACSSGNHQRQNVSTVSVIWYAKLYVSMYCNFYLIQDEKVMYNHLGIAQSLRKFFLETVKLLKPGVNFKLGNIVKMHFFLLMAFPFKPHYYSVAMV